MKEQARILEQIDGVSRATVFRAIVHPPTARFSGYLKERAGSLRPANFDVFVLVEARSPELAESLRSLLMAFALATRHDPSRPWWREQYEGSVRGLAVLESRGGRRVVDLALKQFEFGASARSVAFLGLALLGRPGVRLWEAMRDRRSA